MRILPVKLFLTQHLRVEPNEITAVGLFAGDGHLDPLAFRSTDLVTRPLAKAREQMLKVRAQIKSQGTSRAWEGLPTVTREKGSCGICKCPSPLGSDFDIRNPPLAAFRNQASQAGLHQFEVIANRTSVHRQSPDRPQNSPRRVEHPTLCEPLKPSVMPKQCRIRSTFRSRPLGQLEGM